MIGNRLYLRYLAPTLLSSLLLLVLVVFIAVHVSRLQSTTAEILRENIGSRHAADSLEATLHDLIILLRDRADQAHSLHQRMRDQLALIQHFADKSKEQEQWQRLVACFARYEALYEKIRHGSPAEREGAFVSALEELHAQMLPICQHLQDFNAEQITLSESSHLRTLQLVTWGLGGVGGVGAVAGLVFGYGVARWLRRSIHQLEIRIQDASDKLGAELPPLVVDGRRDMHELDCRLDKLVKQVEEVVEKLHQREREVLRAKQLAAVGQLASGVAHEIRNPITAIKILVQAHREEAPPATALGQDLRLIESEIQRVEGCLRTFLDFARPPRLQRHTVDVAALIGRTLELVRGRAARQRVALHFTAPCKPVPIAVDAERIQQVLVNLTLNALDAMPSGGALRLELNDLKPAFVSVSVSDTGPGIPQEIQPRLFEPFVSSKETGLGLGLVISRRIVEDHGGRLLATNLAEGACFSFELPAAS